MFSDPSHIPLFLNYLNSQHPNIKFTCENEAKNFYYVNAFLITFFVQLELFRIQETTK